MPAKTPLASDKIDAPAAFAVPFCPHCGGVVTRTRYVSQYMLVLALCLVTVVVIIIIIIIRMGHDNAGGPGAAWFLERVEIELPLLHRSWNFPHSRWISKDEDDKTLEHVLYPDSADCALP